MPKQNTASHTATPWLWDDETRAIYNADDIAKQREARKNETYDHWATAIVETDGGQYGPKPEDAAFIVRAVNAHDALVEALRGVLMAIEQFDNDGNALAFHNARRKGRAALKRAKGES